MTDPAPPPSPATPPVRPPYQPPPGSAVPPRPPLPPQAAAIPPAHGAPPAAAYAPPYVMPRAAQPVAVPPRARTRTLGVVALIAGIVAAVVSPLLGAVAGVQIGRGVSGEFLTDPTALDIDWSVLTPVRGWVLLGEISFWVGTAFGVWALAQGIVAIVRGRGTAFAIGAVVAAVLGPVIWAVAVQGGLAAGFVAAAGG